MGERIDIGELYRKRLYLNHSSATENSNGSNGNLTAVSQVSDVSEAIELSTAQSRARRILRDAAKEARKLLKNARTKAESLHDAGRKRAEAERLTAVEEGYSSGYKDGLAKGMSQLELKLCTMNEVLNDLKNDRDAKAVDLPSDLADLVILISEKVVGVLLEDKAAVIRENIIQAATDSFAGAKSITVRLSPDEFELLSDDLGSISTKANCRVSIVCENSLSSGECRILSPAGGIAFSFDKRFAIMKDQLRKSL